MLEANLSKRDCHLIRVVYISCALLLLLGPVVKADYSTTVDPSDQFQTFKGWGISLAWWANVVGGYPEPARSDYMEKAFDPVKGLGLNVVRYNIGGGENPLYMAPNKQFLQYRAAVPGFEPSPGIWDWNADSNQRWVLRDAIRRGANQVEAASFSPPYWMTIGGSVTGNVERKDNLKSEFDVQYAEYLAEVVKHFHDDWGVTFTELDPFNEPSNWWTLGYWQEGCVIDRAHQTTLIKRVGKAIARLGAETSIAASDETSIKQANDTTQAYDAEALKLINKINVHSYGGGDRTKIANFANANAKDLWLSEYGDNDESGLKMSRRILEDINGLHPTVWAYWQIADSKGGWGFLKNPLIDRTTTEYTVNKKYYVMANYSRFIRPGFRFIAIGDRNSLAAYDVSSKTLVIVTTNDTKSIARVTYDLSKFNGFGPVVQAYRTSPSEDLAHLAPIEIAGARFSLDLPPRSVTTYRIVGAGWDGQVDINYRDYYQLFDNQTGLALSVNPANESILENRNDADSQQWGFISIGDGFYKIVNRCSGLVLEISIVPKDRGVHAL